MTFRKSKPVAWLPFFCTGIQQGSLKFIVLPSKKLMCSSDFDCWLSVVVVGRSSLSVVRPCQSFVLVSRSSLSVVCPCQSFVLVSRSSLSVVCPCQSFVLVSRSSLSVVRPCQSLVLVSRLSLLVVLPCQLFIVGDYYLMCVSWWMWFVDCRSSLSIIVARLLFVTCRLSISGYYLFRCVVIDAYFYLSVPSFVQKYLWIPWMFLQLL